MVESKRSQRRWRVLAIEVGHTLAVTYTTMPYYPMTYYHYDLPPTSMASTRPWLPTTCAATSASES